jgi:CheY-like chemotaxis protein
MYRHIGILVCDDSEHDLYFLKRAFADIGVNARLEFVSSGFGAMDYLLGKGGHATRTVPMLTILDIKMPGMNGLELLHWIRSQPAPLNTLPVLMLSSSILSHDIDRAHELGCNGYAVKPNGMDGMREFVRSVEAYWLRQHKYPSCCGRGGVLGAN